MNNKVELRTQALDLLRFPLAIVILTLHIFAAANADIATYKLDAGNAIWVFNSTVQFIEAFFRNQSVPIYFFISGYVFFIGLQKWSKEKYIKKITNRKKSLLYPYLIWNTIMLLASLIVFYIAPNIMNGQLGDFTIEGFLSVYWRYDGTLTNALPSYKPINYPLWFVRDLMIIVLLAPILYKAIKKFGRYVVVLFAFLWATLRLVGVEIIPSADGLLFFSFGAYMSINGKDMIEEFYKYNRVAAVSFILLGIAHIIAQNYNLIFLIKIIKIPMIFAGLFFAYNISAWLISRKNIKVNKFLSSSSFFIYISHAVICSKVLLLIKIIINPNNGLSLTITYLVSVAATVLILLSIFYLMSKFTPKLLSVIAGRKG